MSGRRRLLACIVGALALLALVPPVEAQETFGQRPYEDDKVQ